MQNNSDFATTTSNYVRDSREYVRTNPAKGIAIAVSAGALVGCLLTMALRGRSAE